MRIASLSSLLTLIVFWTVAACAAAPPDYAKSPLGLNLREVRDWSADVQFVDVFRAARTFQETSPGVEVDKHGWVKSLGGEARATTYMLWDIKGRFPSGRYEVTYNGKGRISYGGGAEPVSRSEGRDVISLNAAENGLQLDIIATDPDDPIRDIRVVMPGGICASDPFTRVAGEGECKGDYQSFKDHHATQLFNPDYLNFLRPFKVLRFMDLMGTNASPLQHWSERPRVTDATWSTRRGVPVEILVELANRMNADAWFTLPHRADDEYVFHFAEYVRDHLNPALKVYVEYSNEVWNSAFEQNRYALEMGQKLRLDSDKYTAAQMFYSKRAVEIFKIFEKVFGGDERLVKVLASQAANAWFGDLILGYGEAARHADALAIAPYFGGHLGDPSGAERVERLSVAALFDEVRTQSLPEAIEWMEANAKVAKKHGVDLIAYEGGHHLAGFHGAENRKKLNDLFDNADRHRQMRAMTTRYLDAWRKAGGTLFVYYSSPTKTSKWGRWGLTDSLYRKRAEAPKYDAVLEFIENNPRWW
ncbi:MAG: hypothetical protein ACFCUG_09120 [Thiotrichales bacterium]